jgi:triosephosphate isomerase (TIM)
MKKLILANFKSNKSIEEAESWLKSFVDGFDKNILDQFDVSIAPSYVSLLPFFVGLQDSKIGATLSVQDISAYPAGSYTGAVGLQNLSELDIKYAIVGHSERRRYFNEDHQLVARKVEQAVAGNITPIICVDESYLEEQLSIISDENMSKSIVAFEPVEAIGSGNNADLGTVKSVCDRVKKLNSEVGFIYGGSVDDSNVAEYLIETDGVLVASASLDADNFLKLIKTLL